MALATRLTNLTKRKKNKADQENARAKKIKNKTKTKKENTKKTKNSLKVESLAKQQISKI